MDEFDKVFEIFLFIVKDLVVCVIVNFCCLVTGVLLDVLQT